MQEQNLSEIWQVDVNGTIYEAPFHELGEWIDGGSLLPEDKVRKGNLRWIEARKVPALVPFFNAKTAGEPMPVTVTTTVSESEPFNRTGEAGQAEAISVPEPIATSLNDRPINQPQVENVIDSAVCALHTGVESSFLCDGCGNGFCRGCPSSYGGSVKICPLCSALCRPAAEVQSVKHRAETISRDTTEGFGLGDFAAALGHPFKFKTSLLLGALLYMFFTLASGAGGLGGIMMVGTGLIASMAANAIAFGILANTINNFVQGKLEENFMPDFDDFSIWEDVVHPFFLYIAAVISSFGPAIAVALFGFYLITSSVSTKMDAYKSDLEKIPGTNVYAGRKLADQSGDVKDVLSRLDQKQRERIEGLTASADSIDDPAEKTNQPPVIDEESRQQEELWAIATESRKQSLESTLGKSPETEAREQAETIQAFLGLAAPIVVIGGIALLWGLLFFPAACAVAGYTRSSTATINPLVGLDTIRRLGLDYVKILFMGFILGVMAIVVSGILAAIFAPFDLPSLGNLPAKALGSLFTFYVSVVFSCLLGYALYKSADKLGLSR